MSRHQPGSQPAADQTDRPWGDALDGTLQRLKFDGWSVITAPTCCWCGEPAQRRSDAFTPTNRQLHWPPLAPCILQLLAAGTRRTTTSTATPPQSLKVTQPTRNRHTPTNHEPKAKIASSRALAQSGETPTRQPISTSPARYPSDSVKNRPPCHGTRTSSTGMT